MTRPAATGRLQDRCGQERLASLMPERGWNRPFDEPIPLPRGRELVSLEEAGTYITKLPKAEYEALESQAAMEVLILIATSGGPTMSARIGMLQALNHGKSSPAAAPCCERARASQIVS
jgi:hypothetical protein